MEGLTTRELDLVHEAALAEDAGREIPSYVQASIGAARQDYSRRQQRADLFDALAALLRGNPHIPVPYISGDGGRLRFHFFGPGAAERLKEARRAIRAGHWKKEPYDTEHGAYFTYVAVWHGAEVELLTSRDEVCRRVLKETREVTEMVKDPALLAAVPEVEVTRTEEIYEWVCEQVTAPAGELVTA